MLFALGGLAILMRGLSVLSQSLAALIGGPARRALTWATASALRSWLVGLGVGAVTLNSTALSLTAINLTESGIAGFAAALMLGLGAKAGATLALQLTVTPIGTLGLPLIGIGYLISLPRRTHVIGEVLVGLGLLLFGVNLMVQGLLPVTNSELFRLVRQALEVSPFGLWLLGFVIAGALGSANAVTAIALALATSGALSLPAALALTLGGGAGSGGLIVLSSWKLGPQAQRVAAAHLGWKTLWSLPWLGFLPLFAALCEASANFLGMRSNAAEVTQAANLSLGLAVAQGHLIYHLTASLAALPFLRLLEHLSERFLPDTGREIAPKYITPDALESRALASSLALREVGRIGDQLAQMFSETIRILGSGQGDPNEVARREDKVDQLARAVVLYLSDLASKHPGESPLMLMMAASELEHMGDQMRRILRMQNKLSAQNLSFSSEGRAELASAAELVRKRLQLSLAALATRDLELAEQVMSDREHIEHELLEYRRSHLNRLQKGQVASRATTLAHLDLLIVLDELDQSLTRVAALARDLHEPGDPARKLNTLNTN
jgi:phosphate:Na+ symporter